MPSFSVNLDAEAKKPDVVWVFCCLEPFFVFSKRRRCKRTAINELYPYQSFLLYNKYIRLVAFDLLLLWLEIDMVKSLQDKTMLNKILLSKYTWVITCLVIMMLWLTRSVIITLGIIVLTGIAFFPILTCLSTKKKSSFVFSFSLLVLYIGLSVFMVINKAPRMLYLFSTIQCSDNADSINIERSVTALWFYIIIIATLLLFDVAKRYRRCVVSTAKKQKWMPDPSIGGTDHQFHDDYAKPYEYKITPVLIIAEGLYEMLITHGYEKFIMYDYFPPSALSFKKLSDRMQTEKTLYRIMLEILKYLELWPNVSLRIDYVSDKDGKNDETAGQFKSSQQSKSITVKIAATYEPDNIIAILCHECTHYFMEYHRLACDDQALNEKRTDILANLIGFSRIMADGYKEVTKVRDDGYKQVTTTHKIGYITEQDCLDIHDFLNAKRCEIEKQKNNENMFSHEAETLRKLIETAEVLFQQIRSIDLYKIEVRDEANLYKLQQIMYEYENRNISVEIDGFKSVLSTANGLEAIKKANKEATILCTVLITWMHDLQELQ